MKSIFAILLISAAGTAVAGSKMKSVEDGWTIPFYYETGKNQYTVRFNYPGQHRFVEDGVFKQRWDAPDCLVLAGSYEAPSDDLMKEFLGRIRVADGPSILFGNGPVTPIEAVKENGTFVYFLRDLGAYVTGLQVKTKDDSKTLYEVAQETLGDEATNLVLTLNRGCTLVDPR